MRSHREIVLFQDGDLHGWLGQRRDQAVRDADALPEAQILSASLDDLVDHLSEKHEVEMVALDPGGITVPDHGDIAVPRNDFGLEYSATVHGVAFAVPFKGEPALFRYRGSTWHSMNPRADVGPGELTITILSENSDALAMRERLDRELDTIRKWLGGVAPLVAEYNRDLAIGLRSRLDARKKRVLERSSLVANIGFPVRARGQQAVPVPLTRKRIVPALASANTGKFVPEPAISGEDYEAILRTMHQMTLVMERSPGVFASADEESIRTHFLVQLNGQYEGGASGETFNGIGKTDILIRVEGKNVFIAECKFWKGPESLHKAIDQLMGYLSWRDTKCAVVVLVRDTEMSTVLTKVPDVVRGHPLFKREKNAHESTWFRAIFHHPGDRNREALVTLMIFDVPRGA